MQKHIDYKIRDLVVDLLDTAYHIEPIRKDSYDLDWYDLKVSDRSIKFRIVEDSEISTWITYPKKMDVYLEIMV